MKAENYNYLIKEGQKYQQKWSAEAMGLPSDKELSSIIEQYNQVQAHTEKLTDFFASSNLTAPIQNYFKELGDGSASLDGLKNSLTGAANASGAVSAGMKAASVGMGLLKAAGKGLALGLAELALTAVVNWVDDLIHADERAIEKADALKKAYANFKQTSDGNIASLQGMRTRFDELSKGVGTYGQNISLTTAEYAEYQNIVNQIVGLSPSLAAGYDAEGNAIANKNGLLEKSIKLQKEEARQRQEQQYSGDNLDSLFEGAEKSFDNANNQLKNSEFSEYFKNKLQFSTTSDSLEYSKHFAKIFGEDTLKPYKRSNAEGYRLDDFINENLDLIYEKRDSIVADDFFKEDAQIILDASKDYVAAINNLNRANDQFTSTAQGVFQSDANYGNLSLSQQTFLNTIAESYTKDDFKNSDEMSKILHNLVGSLVVKDSEEFDELLNLQNEIEAGSLTKNQAAEQMNGLAERIYDMAQGSPAMLEALKINNMDKDEAIAQLSITLGFDANLAELEQLKADVAANLGELPAGVSLDDESISTLRTYRDTIGGLDLNGEQKAEAFKIISSGSEEALQSLHRFSAAVKESSLEGPQLQNIFEKINNLGWENGENEIEKLEQFNKLLSAAGISDTSTIQNIYESFDGSELVEINNQLENGALSADEYNQKIKKIAESIGNLSPEQIEAISNAFEQGLDEEVVNEAIENAEQKLSNLKGASGLERNIIASYVESDIGALQELQQTALATHDYEAYNQLANVIQRLKSGVEGCINPFNALQSELDLCSSAMEEQAQNGFLSAETYQSLIALNPEYMRCLESEGGVLRLNEEAMTSLAEARKEDTLAQIEEQKNLDIQKLKENAAAIEILKDSTDANSDATQAQITALEENNVALQKSISNYDLLEQQINASTTAKNEFEKALQGPEKDDNLKTRAKALESINEGLKTGATNTREFQAAVKYMEMDGLTLDQIQSETARRKKYYNEENGLDAFKSTVNEKIDSGELDGLIERMDLGDGQTGFKVWAEDMEQLAAVFGLSKNELIDFFQALDMYNPVDYADKLETLTVGGSEGLMGLLQESGVAEGNKVNLNELLTFGDEYGFTEDQIRSLVSQISAINDIEFTDAEGNLLILSEVMEEILDRFPTMYETLDSLMENEEYSKSITKIGEQSFEVDLTSFIEAEASAGRSKEEITDIITKMSETDGIKLLKDGEVVNLQAALAQVDTTVAESEVGDLQKKCTDLQEDLKDTQTAFDELNGRQIGDLGFTSLLSKVEKVAKAVTTIVNSLPMLSLVEGVLARIKPLLGIGPIEQHANGTDSAPGGVSLTGEEGPELVQSGDKAYIVGGRGPELVSLRPGDRVYTASETRQIMSRVRNGASGTFRAYAGGTGSKSSSSDDANREWKEKFQADLDDLEYLRDMNRISEERYYHDLERLNKQYFKDRVDFLEEYRKYEVKVYEWLLDTRIKKYERTQKAVNQLLDKEMDALKEQQQAVEDQYDERIQLIRDEIDALKEKNEQTDWENKLAEARKEVETAKTQKTNLIYREGLGFIYEADLEKVKKAEDKLRDLEQDKMIDDLEKRIDGLEDLKDKESEVYDQKIDNLKEYQEAWGDALDEYENAQDALMAQEILGANWEADILAQRLDVLQKFTQEYTALQREANPTGMATIGGGGSKASQPKVSNVEGYIRKGQSGENVRLLQQALDALGYKLNQYGVDGNFGTETLNALKKFQRDMGITADGVVGPDTKAKFRAKGYALGGVDTAGGMALLHGKPHAVETIFNAADGRKLYDFIHATPDLVADFMGRLMTRVPLSAGGSGAQQANIQIGDIHLHGVQDTDTLARNIVNKFPGRMLQEMYRR
ncbi:peptidoglycan-binding domain-containing protein [Gehongia tenuis]|uniref:Peptidoglycan-binding protein n=1 Tax=Gehongia tenuis TaxID=2763655 RepID=A0A926D6V0_9FIRM|nr:peptidoglycan-binding domain-containing protein [Gehongia tenuis]MBC8531929.1 peptidoglycan-binding protein [Gehongia tenuis]